MVFVLQNVGFSRQIDPHCVLSSITGTILPVRTQLFVYCTIQLHVSAEEYRYASLNDGDTF